MGGFERNCFPSYTSQLWANIKARKKTVMSDNCVDDDKAPPKMCKNAKKSTGYHEFHMFLPINPDAPTNQLITWLKIRVRSLACRIIDYRSKTAVSSSFEVRTMVWVMLITISWSMNAFQGFVCG